MQRQTASLVAYRITVDLDVKLSMRGGTLFHCWGHQPGNMLPQCTALSTQQRHRCDSMSMAPAATDIGGDAVMMIMRACIFMKSPELLSIAIAILQPVGLCLHLCTGECLRRHRCSTTISS